MKVIQSYAQLPGTNQYIGSVLNGQEVYLNLYSFLLSYLTLKKYYGHVTMYCNQLAFSNFIKHIPYDEVIFVENAHSNMIYWSYYKVQIMNQMEEDFVHVDSDVFLFDDLLRPFIDRKVDGIVQDAIPAGHTFVMDFVRANVHKLNPAYDGRCYSCGVIGMTKDVLSKYREKNGEMYTKVVNNEYNALKKNQNIYCGIIEELGFYLTCMENEYKIHEILPHELIVNGNQASAGNKMKYTHMWGGTKYKRQYIDLIKNKIKKEFPTHAHLLDVYDQIIEVNKVRML